MAQDKDKNIQINSDKFFSLLIPVSQVIDWLKVIWTISGGTGDLDLDLKKSKMYVLETFESRAIYMVSELIAMEASGKIHPPINIYETYRNLPVEMRGTT